MGPLVRYNYAMYSLYPWSLFEIESFDGADSYISTSPVFADLEACLSTIYFTKNDVIAGGGGKTTIAKRIEDDLHRRDWIEKAFELPFEYKGERIMVSTHKIDAVKGRVAVEVEWNTKDTSFDRDLNAFRLLHCSDRIDCGVIITRSADLQRLFKDMVGFDGLSASKFMSTTTHFGRLLPKLLTGSAGGCPILVISITDKLLRTNTRPIYPLKFSDDQSA